MDEVLNANTIKFYLFVGRATPPHSGHISVIHKTIELARAGRTCALILLGDGPYGGLRTRSNPIEHDTKAEFIRHRLRMLHYEEQIDYVILKKDAAPVRQVVGFVSERIPPNITEISISQVAGDKDDDTIKLGWILTHSCKRLQELYPKIQISNGEVKPVLPEITAKAEKAMSAAMSATFVRETAVDCYKYASNNMDTAFTAWLEAFPFYSEDEQSQILSRTMFEQIIKYKDITNPGSGSGSARASKKPKPGGGSRRNHTRRRASNLRNKKTLRTNRRHNKHRHTRRRN